MAKIVYPDLEVGLCIGEQAITEADAKEMLAWTEEADGEDWGKDYLFKDLFGKKIKLLNSPTNRPFRRPLAERYKSELIRRKFKVNGETIVIDRLGHVQSGQHRLTGIVLANQERSLNPKTVAQHWKTPIVMETIVVTGISEKKEVADTLDLGQGRTLGDVIFRRAEFTDAAPIVKRMSNILSGAIRLVWLRSGGKTVSGAPHFPHSEALEFYESNPELKEAVLYIVQEDGKEGKLRKFLSLGYAAGLHYLMVTSKSKSRTEVSVTQKKKAKEFWAEIAAGEGLKANDPVHTLRETLIKMQGSAAGDRDKIVGMVIKAWNAYLAGEKLTTKQIKMKEKLDRETGKRTLEEFPRIGGLDQDFEESDNGQLEEMKLKPGQTVWVDNGEDIAWEGKVDSAANLDWVNVASVDDGNVYEVPLKDIKLKQPEAKAKEEAEAVSEGEEAEAGAPQDEAPKPKRGRKPKSEAA